MIFRLGVKELEIFDLGGYFVEFLPTAHGCDVLLRYLGFELSIAFLRFRTRLSDAVWTIHAYLDMHLVFAITNSSLQNMSQSIVGQ